MPGGILRGIPEVPEEFRNSNFLLGEILQGIAEEIPEGVPGGIPNGTSLQIQKKKLLEGSQR